MGVIHPYAVLFYKSFEPLGLLFLLIFIIYIVKFIANFIRDLFKPEKKILTNLRKIVLSIVLAYIFVLVISLSHYTSFGEMWVHYLLVKDYDTIRIWAKNVEIPEGGLFYINGIDIPEPAKPFHPENVEVKEEDGTRRLWLSWNSGLMQVGWGLIICPPDDIYQTKRGMLVKIQPGVYLHSYH
jgi:hypothetical protein